MTRHERHMNTVLTMARDVEPVAAARIAAMIVKRGTIVSYGFCQLKTHPLQKRYARKHSAIYLHAEIHAITNALRYHPPKILDGADMYVGRMKFTSSDDRTMIPGNSCPCSGCRKAIDAFGIRNVYHSIDDYYDYNMMETE